MTSETDRGQSDQLGVNQGWPLKNESGCLGDGGEEERGGGEGEDVTLLATMIQDGAGFLSPNPSWL